jgi:hypothetical protein
MLYDYCHYDSPWSQGMTRHGWDRTGNPKKDCRVGRKMLGFASPVALSFASSTRLRRGHCWCYQMAGYEEWSALDDEILVEVWSGLGDDVPVDLADCAAVELPPCAVGAVEMAAD